MRSIVELGIESARRRGPRTVIPMTRPCTSTSAPRPQAIIDSEIGALGPPELLDFLPECGNPGLSFQVPFGIRHQHADSSHLFGLLCGRCERPRRHRTAKKRDKFAPS